MVLYLACLTDVYFLMQIKRKLPKVNRGLAAKILENEDEENEKKIAEIDKNEKKSKKKKGLTSEIFKDERFEAMFKKEVKQTNYLLTH